MADEAGSASAGRRRYDRTVYAQRVARVQRLCQRIEGGESLAAACQCPTMPVYSTVQSWLARHAELAAMVEEAREAAPGVTRRRYKRYSAAVAAEFLARIEAGRGLREVCAEPDMPAHCTITRWLAENEAFAAAYRMAREAQADRLFDLAWRLACESTEATARADKLKIDTLKWRVGRLVPRRYGPWKAVVPEMEDQAMREPRRIIVEVRDFTAGPDNQTVETTRVVRGLAPDEVRTLYRAVKAGRFTLGSDGRADSVDWRGWDG